MDRAWILYTTSGDSILVDYDSVKIVEGENSHKKEETIAKLLVGEDGSVTCYDELTSYGKQKK